MDGATPTGRPGCTVRPREVTGVLQGLSGEVQALIPVELTGRGPGTGSLPRGIPRDGDVRPRVRVQHSREARTGCGLCQRW